MSDSSLKQQLKVITIPVFIEIALVMLLGAVDTVMLSRYSDNSVAAVGLDNQLMSLVFLVYQFFSMGAAILCAQYIGAGKHKRLVQVVGMALVVNLLLGLTVSALLFLFAENLLHLMGLRPELMGDGVVYLRLTGALSFFQALSLTFSASLRSADKVVWPMAVTGIVNVLNILGNYALIFGHWGCPQLGVEGACEPGCLYDTVGDCPFPRPHPTVPAQLLPSDALAGTQKSAEDRHPGHEREHQLQSLAGGHHLFHQPDQQRGTRHTHLLLQHDYVRLSVLCQHHAGRRYPRGASRRPVASSGSLCPGQLLLPMGDDHHANRFHPACFGRSGPPQCFYRQRGNHPNGHLGACGRCVP